MLYTKYQEKVLNKDILVSLFFIVGAFKGSQ